MCGRCLSRRGLAGAAAALAVARYATAAEHDAPVEPHMRLPLPADDQAVALTFDACPGAFDMRIASALIDGRIAATIFVTAVWIRRNPEGLKLLLAHPDLFSLQNHGERHIPPVLGDRSIFGIRAAGDLATIRAEVRNGAQAIEDASGITPRWYRAATGFYSPSAIPEIEAMGFAIGGYSFSADAGASLPAEHVAARMAAAKSGDVVVAHINQPLRPSGEGVVAGLRELRRRGLRFVRLDEAAPTSPPRGQA
ncbi:MAG TPA: polysaccharide deacetylase family protein [Acetobacteraceae bacterium]|nr:polysaccharide deacetylase family protein [Acetobacteraceae bacterium]